MGVWEIFHNFSWYTSNTCTFMFTTAKRQKPKCPSMDEWVNKSWSIHTTVCYSDIRRNEVLMHATAWKNLEKIKPSESSKSQDSTFFFLSFCLFRAIHEAYGSSQARGPTGAVAAGLHHSHSNTGSK